MNNELAINHRDLRNFGLVVGALIAMIFGLVLPLLHRRPVPLWPWALGALLTAAALIRPAILYHFNVVWNVLAKGLGWINTHLILGLLFYAVITPMGLFIRLLGRGSSRANGSSLPTYRVASSEISRASFERPY